MARGTSHDPSRVIAGSDVRKTEVDVRVGIACGPYDSRRVGDIKLGRTCAGYQNAVWPERVREGCSGGAERDPVDDYAARHRISGGHVGGGYRHRDLPVERHRVRVDGDG